MSPPPLSTRSLRMVRWCLRIAVAVQCVGAARLALSVGSPIFALLWHPPDLGGLGWSEATALAVDQLGGWLLLAAAGLTLVRPCWPVLAPVALWFGLFAAVDTWLGGHPFSHLALPAHAARIIAPLALIVIDRWPRRELLSRERVERGVWLLRVAASLTFAAHGWEALQLNPRFIDLLIGAANHLPNFELRQPVAEDMLRAIAACDFVIAGLLVTTRWRSVAYYMALWGAITALSRVVAHGWIAHPQTLIRAANAGVPLAVALYWSLLRLKECGSAGTDGTGGSREESC